MRIRMLAAAVVTAGALMATLTGAASADDTPAPAPLPEDGVVIIDCEGGGQVTLTTRRLTEAEREKLEKEGPTLAVPALPAVPSGQAGETGKPEAGRVTITEDILVARPDAEPPALPEGAAPPKRVKVMATPALPEGAPKAGEVAALSAAVPAPEGAGITEVKVTGKHPEGDVPTVTCVRKAEEK
ncbi:hypothetical protein AB0G15_21920 [Streptosporangium sp. NPDC023825]|uniref:hypothetical protein n=1 Tax=Streptosporangium sp. NPDC023825 TaxID=3154909 RepID=UPI00342C5C46